MASSYFWLPQHTIAKQSRELACSRGTVTKYIEGNYVGTSGSSFAERPEAPHMRVRNRRVCAAKRIEAVWSDRLTSQWFATALGRQPLPSSTNLISKEEHR